jgi:hypothetical protein
MNNQSIVNTVITAAVVVVILPLLALVAAVCASFGIDVAGLPVGMFGTMGAAHLLMLIWTIAATIIVGALVALLVSDQRRHA